MDTDERVAVLEPNDSFCMRIFGFVAKQYQNRICTQFRNYEDFRRNWTAFDSFIFNENFYMIFLKDPQLNTLLSDCAQRSYVITDDDGKPRPIFALRRSRGKSSDEFNAKLETIEDDFLRDLFLKLGFRHNLTGCRYLKAAIKLTSRDPSYLNKGITKRLYPKLAESFGSNPSSIERGIRHALSVCFENGKFKAQASVFGNCFDGSHCPTNGEFIALVADMLSTKVKSAFSAEMYRA